MVTQVCRDLHPTDGPVTIHAGEEDGKAVMQFDSQGESNVNRLMIRVIENQTVVCIADASLVCAQVTLTAQRDVTLSISDRAVQEMVNVTLPRRGFSMLQAAAHVGDRILISVAKNSPVAVQWLVDEKFHTRGNKLLINIHILVCYVPKECSSSSSHPWWRKLTSETIADAFL